MGNPYAFRQNHNNGAGAKQKMPLSSTIRPVRQCGNCDFRSLRMFCSLGRAALDDFESIGDTPRFPAAPSSFRRTPPARESSSSARGRSSSPAPRAKVRTLILKIAMPGDVLGLGAVISGSKYEVTAETVQPTRSRAFVATSFSPSSRGTDRPACTPRRHSPKSTRRAFFDARRLAALRFHRRAGSPACCSTGSRRILRQARDAPHYGADPRRAG